MNKNKGEKIIFLTLVITLILWFLAKPDFIAGFKESPVIFLNQISALFGTVLFSWSFFTATRFNFLDKWFGGMDKVYEVHKKVSIWGFILIIGHLFFLAVGNIDNFSQWFFAVEEENGVKAGIISFWIFFFLITMTLFMKKIKIPYHYWKFTHKFINLAMFFALLHVLKVESDTSRFMPLGVWIKTLMILALLSGLYKTFFYKYFAKKYKYKIIKIKKYKDTYDIYLKPISKKMKFISGQFAYITFLSKSEKISKESHPFSIASAPFENNLRFTIKKLGDFTSNLDNLKNGEEVVVYGPHGELGQKFFSEKKKEAIFIGGGIGIAPFLSMFKTASQEIIKRKVSLFYAVNSKKDAYFDLELEELADKNDKLSYISHFSKESDNGYLNADQIFEKINDKNNIIVYICGPKGMMTGLSEKLVEKGLKKENIVFEDFSMF